MDAFCRNFVQQVKDSLATEPNYILEIGSRNINGCVRDLFPEANYTGIDLVDGRGVDTVANGTIYQPLFVPDAVLCCNVFEHTNEWPMIIDNVWKVLSPGGVLILTAATDPWPPHSGFDGGALNSGEWYENISMELLKQSLNEFKVTLLEKDEIGHIMAVAYK